MAILIETNRTGYSVEQCGRTFTVEELVEYLMDEYGADWDDDECKVKFWDNDKVYFSNDNGYTYGEIDENCFREV